MKRTIRLHNAALVTIGLALATGGFSYFAAAQDAAAPVAAVDGL